jgi:hypothetical protein
MLSAFRRPRPLALFALLVLGALAGAAQATEVDSMAEAARLAGESGQPILLDIGTSW